MESRESVPLPVPHPMGQICHPNPAHRLAPHAVEVAMPPPLPQSTHLHLGLKATGEKGWGVEPLVSVTPTDLHSSLKTL